MSEAYILLNVNFREQKTIIEKIKNIPTVTSVKSVYGIYDILVIMESENMQEIKNAIDVDLHSIGGITNLTPLIAV